MTFTEPLYKELCRRYRANRQTVKRALDRLLADGVLRRHKRTYESTAATGGRRSEVLLVCRGLGHGDLLDGSAQQHHLVKAVESACLARGLVMVPVSFYYSGTRLTGHSDLRAARCPWPGSMTLRKRWPTG